MNERVSEAVRGAGNRIHRITCISQSLVCLFQRLLNHFQQRIHRLSRVIKNVQNQLQLLEIAGKLRKKIDRIAQRLFRINIRDL